ncbi:hypothetical protein GCM10008119_38260 [Pedobacter mendelii]|uniref:Response regulatory domain-containing protein n=1 Tax=Pedobacter mendelii TaxID=1908240 RepID=A0ABQ2BPP1_9SPHI|nr:hypothetical protein GCM10008119_38260 [Pedobacter mendelii]
MCSVISRLHNEEILWIVGEIFKHAGFESKCSYDPSDLMPLTEEFKPDLILLDVQLGKHDGRQLCSNLQSEPHTQHIPVVLMSANKKSSVLDGFNCKPKAFINKPFDIDELISCVNQQIT